MNEVTLDHFLVVYEKHLLNFLKYNHLHIYLSVCPCIYSSILTTGTGADPVHLLYIKKPTDNKKCSHHLLQLPFHVTVSDNLLTSDVMYLRLQPDQHTYIRKM